MISLRFLLFKYRFDHFLLIVEQLFKGRRLRLHIGSSLMVVSGWNFIRYINFFSPFSTLSFFFFIENELRYFSLRRSRDVVIFYPGWIL